MLKVTIESREKIEDKIVLDDIQPGIVFKYGDNGPIALKLEEDEVVLLKYSVGKNWFALNDGSFKSSDIKILGYLDEIIVVEE